MVAIVAWATEGALFVGMGLISWVLVGRPSSRPQARAWRALQTYLSPAQVLLATRQGYLVERSRRTPGRYYVIPWSRALAPRGGLRSMMVHVYDRDTMALLCVAPDTQFGERQLPPADVALSQLLWLRADEADFCRRANWLGALHPRRPLGVPAS